MVTVLSFPGLSRRATMTLASLLACGCGLSHTADLGGPDGGTAHPSASDAGTCVGPSGSSIEATLMLPDGDSGDFGFSTAISGDGNRLVVGDDVDGLFSAGSARVFARSGTSWGLEATFRATGSRFAYLGRSVAIDADGSRVIAGASGNAPAGSARIFVRSGTSWSQEARLVGDGVVDGAQFGSAVAFDTHAGRAIVGAPNDATAAGISAGSAHIFLRTGSGWSEEARLVPSDTRTGQVFGEAVALSGDGTRAIVGAVYNRPAGGGVPPSRAYIFVRSGTAWSQEAELTAPEGDDMFGTSLALDADGTRALVGASHAHLPDGAGRAHVYVRSGTAWTEEATLVPPNGRAGDYFGRSVALTPDATRAVVGAPLLSEPAPPAPATTTPGAVYVFERCGTAWSEVQSLSAMRDPTRSPQLGWSVGITADGSRVVAGAGDADLPSFVNVFVLTR